MMVVAGVEAGTTWELQQSALAAWEALGYEVLKAPNRGDLIVRLGDKEWPVRIPASRPVCDPPVWS